MFRLASDADVHGDILHGLHRRRLKHYFMVAACGRCFVPPGLIAGSGLKQGHSHQAAVASCVPPGFIAGSG